MPPKTSLNLRLVCSGSLNPDSPLSGKLPLEGDCLDEETTFISLGFKREAAGLCVGIEGTRRGDRIGEDFTLTPKSRCPWGKHESKPLRSD